MVLQPIVDESRRLYVDESGATMIEYALLLGLLALVALAAISVLGRDTRRAFRRARRAMRDM